VSKHRFLIKPITPGMLKWDTVICFPSWHSNQELSSSGLEINREADNDVWLGCVWQLPVLWRCAYSWRESSKFIPYFFFFSLSLFGWELGFELRASHLLGRSLPFEPCPWSLVCFSYFWDSVMRFLPGAEIFPPMPPEYLGLQGWITVPSLHFNDDLYQAFIFLLS
jgi:hypothetical protein